MEKALTQINEQRLSGTRTPDYTTAQTKRNNQVLQQWKLYGGMS